MNFDRIAPWYSAIEKLTAGGLVQKCRLRHVARLNGAKRVLILGEGTGLFLVELLRLNTTVRVEVVESSREMIRITRQRIEESDLDAMRVRFINKDVRDWMPETKVYDGIVTHFFFDCFTADELTKLVPAIASGAGERCEWLFSDFSVPERGLTRIRAKVIHEAMYLFFRMTTNLSACALHDPSALLTESGFALAEREEKSVGLLRCDVWHREARKESTTATSSSAAFAPATTE